MVHPTATTPTPSPTRRPESRPRAALYRVYQLWRSVAARPLDAEDRAIVAATLPEAARPIFYAMSRNDQRHSLTVYRALLVRGCVDADLLAAALLHDSGKGGGRVRLWVRPVFVLLRAFAPGLLRWLARAPETRWRRPFYRAWRHADIGADLAARAGLSERAVLYIRTHHQSDGPAAALHAVDEAV
ncbi:MAG TPA: hypothetical protein VJN88_06095 [Ktedonobacterales bacterium]|nr:hypothetical protein [Ktedonobacterales bacterium]